MTETRPFAVWAPRPRTVSLWLSGSVHAMTRGDDGWWRADVPARSGERYGFLLDAESSGGGDGDASSDDAGVVPDPRSPRQPDGVHAPSAVHDLDPGIWTDHHWTGRPLAGSVIYELHIGTFTDEGTFDAAISRLDHLVDLGVTTVQVMPINAVNGTRNWGYDGVLWFAVHEPYGGPDGFARLVDACHARDLAVALDVVYNHLGPSGNHLGRFGPYTSEGATTWGDAINVAGPQSDPVRRYILDNALRWFEEFHVDALRLDAVHALHDTTAVHLLEELAVETERLSAHLGRPLSLIAESDLNDPRLITPRAAGGYGLQGAWDDDVHHAVHTAVSGERQGYYGDFGSLSTLATTLTRGYLHAGTYSSFRGRRHGRPIDTRTLPASSLVAYTTTHDQVGNRALGDRPGAYLDGGRVAIKAALILFSPFTPMLFMGEEWNASTPFQFFTSHPEPELGEATARGRRAEFAEHGWDAAEIPDPQDLATFTRSTLRWSEPAEAGHARMLACYRDLIRLRRERIEVSDPSFDSIGVEFDEDQRWIAVHRGRGGGERLTLVANLAADPVVAPFGGRPILWWDAPVNPEPGADTVTVPGHSFVVLSA